jgi:hypothetical protein
MNHGRVLPASLLTASPAPSGDEAVAARVGRAGRNGGGADVVTTDVAGSHNNSHVIGDEAETLVVVGVLGEIKQQVCDDSVNFVANSSLTLLFIATLIIFNLLKDD